MFKSSFIVTLVLFIIMALALVVHADPLNLTFPSNWEEDFTFLYHS